MSMEYSIYIGLMDGARHHTQHLASATWVIYSPTGQVLYLGGVCQRTSLKNVSEYSDIIELLHDSISHGICSLEVHLDSQLVVS